MHLHIFFLQFCAFLHMFFEVGLGHSPVPLVMAQRGGMWSTFQSSSSPTPRSTAALSSASWRSLVAGPWHFISAFSSWAVKKLHLIIRVSFIFISSCILILNCRLGDPYFTAPRPPTPVPTTILKFPTREIVPVVPAQHLSERNSEGGKFYFRKTEAKFQFS